MADLSENELRQISSFEELDIDNVHIDAVKRCFSEQKSGDLLKSLQKEKYSKLTKTGSYYVFHQTMHDLSLIDTLASAYYSGIVDKDMIIKLFGSLFEAKPVESLIGKLNSIGLTNFMNLEKYLGEAKGKVYQAEKLPLGEKQ